MKNNISQKPVAIILGATATGKTSTLTNVLDKNIEIINSDSLQVYKHLLIGTAKPSQEEQARVKHHLVDILDPREEFSVGKFVKNADKLIPEILSRNNIPIISGGTAFYIHTFLYGLPETPISDEATRAKVNKMLEEEGLENLHKKLQEIDPEAAKNINYNDSYRITRALEVYYISGRKLSSFKIPDTLRENIAPLIIGIHRDRAQLYERINARVEQMFEQGLYEEVKSLIELGYNYKDPAFSAIGYQEFFKDDGSLNTNLSEVKSLIQKNSRRYAKRQITFFKRIPGVIWVNYNDSDKIISLIQEHFKDYGIELE